MMPEHCSEVNLYEVNFPLYSESITKELIGKKVYNKTNYLILINKDERAVIKLIKVFDQALFWKIKKIHIISLPGNTIYIENNKIDVLNKFLMIEVAKEYDGDIVVVKGKFEHVSFVSYEKGIYINVFDVAPPYPVKLPYLIEEVLRSGFINGAVEINNIVIDINDLIKNVTTGSLMMPCHVSSITSDLSWSGNIYYLDRNPDLPEKEINDVTLIGCDSSLRIFEEIYNFTPPFINICPGILLKELQITGPTILRCCGINEFEADNGTALVPWGASINDIGEALEYLIETFDI
jgi:hypothetical protein